MRSQVSRRVLQKKDSNDEQSANMIIKRYSNEVVTYLKLQTKDINLDNFLVNPSKKNIFSQLKRNISNLSKYGVVLNELEIQFVGLKNSTTLQHFFLGTLDIIKYFYNPIKNNKKWNSYLEKKLKNLDQNEIAFDEYVVKINERIAGDLISQLLLDWRRTTQEEQEKAKEIDELIFMVSVASVSTIKVFESECRHYLKKNIFSSDLKDSTSFSVTITDTLCYKLLVDSETIYQNAIKKMRSFEEKSLDHASKEKGSQSLDTSFNQGLQQQIESLLSFEYKELNSDQSGVQKTQTLSDQMTTSRESASTKHRSTEKKMPFLVPPVKRDVVASNSRSHRTPRSSKDKSTESMPPLPLEQSTLYTIVAPHQEFSLRAKRQSLIIEGQRYFFFVVKAPKEDKTNEAYQIANSLL